MIHTDLNDYFWSFNNKKTYIVIWAEGIPTSTHSSWYTETQLRVLLNLHKALKTDTRVTLPTMLQLHISLWLQWWQNIYLP